MKASRARRRQGLGLLAAASLLATAACGSTVQTSGQSVLGGGAGPTGDGTVTLGADGLSVPDAACPHRVSPGRAPEPARPPVARARSAAAAAAAVRPPVPPPDQAAALVRQQAVGSAAHRACPLPAACRDPA
jgi:hypothetical protein